MARVPGEGVRRASEKKHVRGGEDGYGPKNEKKKTLAAEIYAGEEKKMPQKKEPPLHQTQRRFRIVVKKATSEGENEAWSQNA